MTQEGSEAGSSEVPDGWVLVNGSMVKRAWGNVINGSIPLSELDDEEIARMQLRDRNGGFSGKKPRLLPRELADRQTREVLLRNQRMLQEMILKTTQVYVDVVEDPNASTVDKMKAAEYLQNRFLGKVAERVHLSAEVKPWEGLVQGILTDVGEKKDETNELESQDTDPA